MEIRHSMRDGCLVVAFTGSIDLSSVSQIQRALLKDLSDEPEALICDLSGVNTLDPVCATVFATVANYPASRWPATSFLLCAPSRRWPRSSAGCGCRTSCSCTPASRRPWTRPWTGRRTCATSWCWRRPRPRRPPPAPSCGTCAGTGGSPSRHHRGGPGRAGGQRAGHQRGGPRPHRAAASAGAPRRPAAHRRTGRQLGAPAPGRPRLEAEGGRGLFLVEQLARSWGVNRHPDGGKVVWCVLSL